MGNSLDEDRKIQKHCLLDKIVRLVGNELNFLLLTVIRFWSELNTKRTWLERGWQRDHEIKFKGENVHGVKRNLHEGAVFKR